VRNFIKKINPLDYKSNPIGAFKVELCFHLAGLIILGHIRGSTLVLSNFGTSPGIFNLDFFYVWVIFIISWSRLSYSLTSNVIKDCDSESI
jgi:hypothetical protein